MNNKVQFAVPERDINQTGMAARAKALEYLAGLWQKCGEIRIAMYNLKAAQDAWRLAGNEEMAQKCGERRLYLAIFGDDGSDGYMENENLSA